MLEGMLWVRRLTAGVTWRRCALALVAVVFTSLAPASVASGTTRAVMAWGGNEWGQLGNGARSPSGPVQLVSGLTEPVGIAAGHHHSLALLSNGTVVAWGSNAYGELGNGTTMASNVPAPVSGLTEVASISAGSGFSLALLRNGTVMSWGNNQWGQLGDGTTVARSLPVAVQGLSEATAISAGRRFAIALMRNGTVEMWGYNGSPHEGGELGQGTPIGPQICASGPKEREHAGRAGGRVRSRARASRRHGERVYCSTTPLQVLNLSGVTAITAGCTHSLALLSNGDVMAWGANSFGELGVGRMKLDGGKNRSWLPVRSFVKEAAAVSAGDKYSLVALRNGTAVGFGKDVVGELGDGGSINQKRFPVAVSGLSGAIAISAGPGEGGADHSLALLSNGTVMSWGVNNKEQLGNGGSASSSVPVLVQGLTGVTAISGGGTSHSLALVSK